MSDTCCAGVKSSQVGLEEVFAVVDFFVGAPELADLVEDCANDGGASTSCAKAQEPDAPKASRRVKTDPLASTLVMNG
jgi:hypothetical protein